MFRAAASAGSTIRYVATFGTRTASAWIALRRRRALPARAVRSFIISEEITIVGMFSQNGFETIRTGTCREGASANKATLDHCMSDEEKARSKLATEWDQFAHSDRTNCTDLAKLGTGQSYVELITCLEMAKVARTLPKQ